MGSTYDNWKLDHPDNYEDDGIASNNPELYEAHYKDVVCEHITEWGDIEARYIDGFREEAEERTIKQLEAMR